jgi:hypothetical protein
MKTIIKMKFLVLLPVVTGIMLLFDSCTKAKNAPSLPEGWFAHSPRPIGYFYWGNGIDHPKAYSMGVDRKVSHSGKVSATIVCNEEKAGDNFGTLMQYYPAGNYLGKRIRMSGYMKTKDVKGWAGFWLRVDVDTITKEDMEKEVKTSKVTVNWNYYACDNISYNENRNSIVWVSFDNMHDGKTDRSVRGTTDWTKYEIVLDVPENSSTMAFGALLCGKGQMWFDDLSFEVVDNSVETTGIFKPEFANVEGKPAIGGMGPSNLDFEPVLPEKSVNTMGGW